MSVDEITEYVKAYLDDRIKDKDSNRVELIVKPIIILPWGVVLGYNTKDYIENGGDSFLIGNVPVLFDRILGKIVKLETIIFTEKGQGNRRISTEEALERYRKKNDLPMLDIEHYKDIIERKSVSLFYNEYYPFDQSSFNDLLDILECYKQLSKDRNNLERITIASIFEMIRDFEYILSNNKLSESDKKSTILALEQLKSAFEELLWFGIERKDYFDGTIFYGIKDRVKMLQ